MNESISAVTGILVLATLVESLVEFLVRPLVKPYVEKPAAAKQEQDSVDWRSLLLRYVAAIVGVVLCVIYNVDLLEMVGLVSPVPWVGPIITGFVIGRGANFVHDFASRWIAPGGSG
ncbi:MAG TPA: hypothetical protein VLY63_11670 [Anaerolineae bacterium]|nr:hypothetical protein [Anaerolineae bacterium]